MLMTTWGPIHFGGSIFGTTDPIARWRGHRTFLIDGSTFTMPDTTALMKHFGRPTGQEPGLGFPMAHLMLLCDMTTGLIREVMDSPLFTHDLHAGVKCSSTLQPGDLILADRGFAGWAYFALYVQQKLLMFALAYNLVRMQMADAAIRQKVDPLRISFIDALRAIQSQAGVPPDEARFRSESVPLIINPHRPGRHEPRAIKRCPPQRRLLMEQRAKARKRLYRQGLAR